MKIIRGTVFGGIAFFFLGFLMWGLALASTMESMFDGTLNRPDDGMIWWAMIASNLFLALFLTLFLKWGSVKNWMGGLKGGAMFGGLYALSVDLGIYSMTTMINDLSGVALDVVAYVVVAALSGAIIVLTWGKKD